MKAWRFKKPKLLRILIPIGTICCIAGVTMRFLLPVPNEDETDAKICQRNLANISSMKAQWHEKVYNNDEYEHVSLEDNPDLTSLALTWTMLVEANPEKSKIMPVCPSGSRYEINSYLTEPRCTSGKLDHVIHYLF